MTTSASPLRSCRLAPPGLSVRLVLAVLIAGTLAACGGDGGTEPELERVEVSGTVTIVGLPDTVRVMMDLFSAHTGMVKHIVGVELTSDEYRIVSDEVSAADCDHMTVGIFIEERPQFFVPLQTKLLGRCATSVVNFDVVFPPAS